MTNIEHALHECLKAMRMSIRFLRGAPAQESWRAIRQAEAVLEQTDKAKRHDP